MHIFNIILAASYLIIPNSALTPCVFGVIKQRVTAHPMGANGVRCAWGYSHGCTLMQAEKWATVTALLAVLGNCSLHHAGRFVYSLGYLFKGQGRFGYQDSQHRIRRFYPHFYRRFYPHFFLAVWAEISVCKGLHRWGNPLIFANSVISGMRCSMTGCDLLRTCGVTRSICLLFHAMRCKRVSLI